MSRFLSIYFTQVATKLLQEKGGTRNRGQDFNHKTNTRRATFRRVFTTIDLRLLAPPQRPHSATLQKQRHPLSSDRVHLATTQHLLPPYLERHPPQVAVPSGSLPPRSDNPRASANPMPRLLVPVEEALVASPLLVRRVDRSIFGGKSTFGQSGGSIFGSGGASPSTGNVFGGNSLFYPFLLHHLISNNSLSWYS